MGWVRDGIIMYQKQIATRSLKMLSTREEPILVSESEISCRRLWPRINDRGKRHTISILLLQLCYVGVVCLKPTVVR